MTTIKTRCDVSIPRWLEGIENPTAAEKSGWGTLIDGEVPFMQCETTGRAIVRGGPRDGERVPLGSACFLDCYRMFEGQPTSPALAMHHWQWKNRRYGTNLLEDSPDRPWDAEVRLTPSGEPARLLFLDTPPCSGEVDPFWAAVRVVSTDDPRLIHLPPDAVILRYGRWGVGG